MKQNDVNPALAALAKLQAGFWLSDKELKETVNFLESQDSELERLRTENDQLKAAILPFAKMGERLGFHSDISVVDYGNLEVTYGDFKRAADLLFERDKTPESEEKENH